MSIEIVDRVTCPTCDGREWFEPGTNHIVRVDCTECGKDGEITRVLATFADAAALREMIDSALFVFGGMDSHIMTESMGEEVAGTIMDGLGVTELPQAPAQTP